MEFFCTPPPSESEQGKSDLEQAALLTQRRQQAVKQHVIPALLMPYGIEPWLWTANIPGNADLLKGIIGTHRRDCIVDAKLRASTDRHLFDLLEPVQTGIGFFRKIDQYRRIDEAIAMMERKLFNPSKGMDLNCYQQLILRLALIAWVDRFAPRKVFENGSFSESCAGAIAKDDEFRAYARHFARFLDCLRDQGKEHPGAFKKLHPESVLSCVRYWNPHKNLIMLPHRSATPAICKRLLLSAISPKGMPSCLNGKRLSDYKKAYEQDISDGNPQ